MSTMTILNEIIGHQIQGVMLHDDIANMFDFMDLRGFKRQHEYRSLCEFIEMRKTSRYEINHINMMADGKASQRAKEIIPSSWKSATRFNVGESDRKAKVREIYTKWHDWETETKAFYQNKFKELVDMCEYAVANYVNELIEDVDCELKYLQRDFLKYNAVGWDMIFIFEEQDEIHEHYREKTKRIGEKLA